MELPKSNICDNCKKMSNEIKYKTIETASHFYIYCLCQKCNTKDIDWKVRCEISKS